MADAKDRAKDQARMQVEGICEIMAAWKVAQEKGVVTYEGEELDEDTMRERIDQDALSVQVRSDWESPGRPSEPVEFEILLCTGGPAMRIIGDLYNGEPGNALVQYQDWFTPWEEYVIPSEEQEKTMLEYCCMYYWGI